MDRLTTPITSVEPGCTCGGMAACPQCQERDATTVIPPGSPIPANGAPFRVCCGQQHYGATCPDGKVMCCVCFERFDKAHLMVEAGVTYDVCRGCEPSVTPPGSDVTP